MVEEEWEVGYTLLHGIAFVSFFLPFHGVSVEDMLLIYLEKLVYIVILSLYQVLEYSDSH